MAFDGRYLDWNQKRIKGILDFYGHKFMFYKKILDLGCGYADISGVFYRLGADITAVDSRPEHLKMAQKKYAGIKTVKADLDMAWPFHGKLFDLVLDLDLICHLQNYESHLKSVCSSTTHLILETAVCDSDDPYKIIPSPENKATYDLSINGMGCYPTAASIERILSESGMSFRRQDSNKYNSGSYSYDWHPKNDDKCNINNRRLWYALKHNSPIQFAHPATSTKISSETILSSSKTSPATLQNSQILVKPISVTTFTKRDGNNKGTYSSITKTNHSESRSEIFHTNSYVPTNNVKENSKKFSLINPESFSSSTKFDVAGIILPLTTSSGMWLKKVSPLFPNLKIHKKAIVMQGFDKSDGTPNMIMCSINNIGINDRIWIEEWSDKNLSNKDIDCLKQCRIIMTPSLINCHEILKSIPDANVNIVSKEWPALDIKANIKNQYIYFEKDQNLTKILLESWKEAFGKLLVVGASISLPSFAKYISNYESYNILFKHILESKAIIDLSCNTYYKSGILNLSKSYNIPIITNNNYQVDNHLATIIQQDKNVSPYPTSSNINKCINKFISNYSESTYTFNKNYNNNINDTIKNMIGLI